MRKTIIQKQFGDSYSRASRAVHNDTAVFLFLAGYLQGIDNPGKDYDGRSMLIVMENRDIQSFLQAFFNFKAAGER